MRSIVRAALANCHLEIQNKLEIQNVLYDIVDVVEASHMNKEISDLQKKLVASELSTEILRTEMNVLSSDKVFNDLEFDRIRSKAVYVRECLVHDLASILSERKQISDYLKRIRELEDRVVELVSFVEKGGQRGSAENVPPPIRTDLQSVDTADPIYEFADSVVQRINKSSIASKCPNGLHTQLNFPKKLGSLEDVCLLLTLSYLDISVVLNVSQVNRHLFARLDRLFQNGSLLVKESWLTVSLELMEVDDTIENNSQVTDLSVIDVEGCERSVTSASDINKAHSINATDESAGSVSMKGPGGEARYFGKFSMLLAAADMLPTGLTAGVMSAVGVKMNAIPSSPASSNGSTYVNSSSAKKIGGNPSNYPISAPGVQSILPAPSSSGGLTREIAESLSKKLSAAEMKAIINMDDLLKKNTFKLGVSLADNEDLTSKLEGILTTRDFLISKLKGAEVALKASMIECTVLKKQAKADEEVINYLDLRGQESEGKNTELTLRSEQLQAAYNLQCSSFSHRETQLFEELADYKKKYEDLDIMYNSHKRMLVREVKSLRGQLGTISLERNKYIGQLLTVKNVLGLHHENN